MNDIPVSPEDRPFLEELRTWLEANIPPGLKPGGRGVQDFAEAMKQWRERLYADRWAILVWPTEWGGRGATVTQQALYNLEMARRRLPLPIDTHGINNVGPLLMAHGNDEQRRRFLPDIASGKTRWCQGYSEPDAGSDLASLKTRAVRDGDKFIINGQKIWTSGAAEADWMYLLARTDPDAPKHAGITMFLVDMKSEGLTVAPIKQITGDQHFCTVFFDNVAVPTENVVGEVNRGWQIAVNSLNLERSGLTGTLQLDDALQALLKLGRDTTRDAVRLIDSTDFMNTLVDHAIEIEAIRALGLRTLGRQARGAVGPESSIGKLATSELRQRMTETAIECLGPLAIFVEGSEIAVNRGNAARGYLASRAQTIGGGTSEVQRNVIAERLIGLPKD